MSIDRYFKGHGSEVMSNMQKEYGDKKGKSVFYATAQKNNMKPKGSLAKAHKVLSGGK